MRFRRQNIFFVSLFVVISLVLPLIFQSNFIQHLLVIIGITVILVLSLDMMLGHAGLVSLGHAGFMGIGAYTCALLVVKYKMPFLVGLVCGTGLAGLLGGVIGYPSLRLRGHYFVIVTFICGIIFTLFFTNLVSITKGPMGIPGIPPPRIGIGEGWSLSFKSKIAYYYLVLAFIFLTVYVKDRLYHSKMGKALRAIREDEDLGKSLGMNTHAYKVGIFVMSTAFAGLAGGLYAHYVRFIGPDSFTMLHSFYFFVMNLIGGSGTIAGPIIGSLLLTVIDELSQLLQPALARILFGIFLILVILYMPKGIMGLRSLWISQVKGE
jgi:branched-chain amino acid transport system permease protein